MKHFFSKIKGVAFGGLTAGIITLLLALSFGVSFTSQIPIAFLAGILITVDIGVMNNKGSEAIPSLPKNRKIGQGRVSSEVWVMLVVLIYPPFGIWFMW